MKLFAKLDGSVNAGYKTGIYGSNIANTDGSISQTQELEGS